MSASEMLGRKVAAHLFLRLSSSDACSLDMLRVVTSQGQAPGRQMGLEAQDICGARGLQPKAKQTHGQKPPLKPLPRACSMSRQPWLLHSGECGPG